MHFTYTILSLRFSSTSLKIWISASCSYAKICLFLVKLSSYYMCV